MFKVARWIGCCSVFAASAVTAKADTIQKFTASGSLSDGATLGGTLTIDTTTGAITASDLTAGSPDSLTFTSIAFENNNYGGMGYTLIYDSTADGNMEVNYIYSSLENFKGGSAAANIFHVNTETYGAQGSLDLSVPATAISPEPSSLLLLGTGALGFMGTLRWRCRLA